jgi:hypothetical protein
VIVVGSMKRLVTKSTMVVDVVDTIVKVTGQLVVVLDSVVDTVVVSVSVAVMVPVVEIVSV